MINITESHIHISMPALYHCKMKAAKERMGEGMKIQRLTSEQAMRSMAPPPGTELICAPPPPPPSKALLMPTAGWAGCRRVN